MAPAPIAMRTSATDRVGRKSANAMEPRSAPPISTRPMIRAGRLTNGEAVDTTAEHTGMMSVYDQLGVQAPNDPIWKISIMSIWRAARMEKTQPMATAISSCTTSTRWVLLSTLAPTMTRLQMIKAMDPMRSVESTTVASPGFTDNPVRRSSGSRKKIRIRPTEQAARTKRSVGLLATLAICELDHNWNCENRDRSGRSRSMSPISESSNSSAMGQAPVRCGEATRSSCTGAMADQHHSRCTP